MYAAICPSQSKLSWFMQQRRPSFVPPAHASIHDRRPQQVNAVVCVGGMRWHEVQLTTTIGCAWCHKTHKPTLAPAMKNGCRATSTPRLPCLQQMNAFECRQGRKDQNPEPTVGVCAANQRASQCRRRSSLKHIAIYICIYL